MIAYGKFSIALRVSVCVLWCLAPSLGSLGAQVHFVGKMERPAAEVLHADTLAEGVGVVVSGTVDPLHQVILGLQDGRILRYDSLMLSATALYSNPRLGAPEVIDAHNPMVLLAYYPNYQQIHLFNRNLIQNSILDLNALGFQMVPTICSARDGNFWLYDALDFQLKKINMQGKVLMSSIRLNTIGLNEPVTFLYDSGDWLFCAFRDGSGARFDSFGQLLETYTQDVASERIAYYPSRQDLKGKEYAQGYIIKLNEKGYTLHQSRSNWAILKSATH